MAARWLRTVGPYYHQARAKRSAANSTLPTWEGATMLPPPRDSYQALIDANLRGAARVGQPSTMANGDWTVRSPRRLWLIIESTLRTFCT